MSPVDIPVIGQLLYSLVNIPHTTYIQLPICSKDIFNKLSRGMI